LQTVKSAVIFWLQLTVAMTATSWVLYLLVQLGSELYGIINNYAVYTAVMASLLALAVTTVITSYYMINRENSMKSK
jgi:hypothetical protein